jgi:hypothetical protein
MESFSVLRYGELGTCSISHALMTDYVRASALKSANRANELGSPRSTAVANTEMPLCSLADQRVLSARITETLVRLLLF